MTSTETEARVLVIDDEPMIVELLAVSLRFQGFDVATAISYLRRKIDTSEPKLLHTLRGVGYVLREPQSSRR